jgi:hygromycin-B 4-O-kinase
MTAGAKPDIDEAGARRFLAGWCGHGPGAVELVGEGEWSRCFAFTRDGRELVVRFGRHVDDFAKDRMAAAWSRSALPVPAVLDIGLAQDGWYAISERMHGEPLDQLDAAGWRAALPAVLNALDALRAIEPPATGFGPWPPPPVGASGSDPTSAGFESWREFLLSAAGDGDPRQRTPVWRDELADAGLATAYDRAADLLTDLADAGPGNRHVVHADLINRNVMVDGSRLTGVFDWGCSLVGDPLFDVAWLDLWAPWHPGLAAVGWRAAALAHLGDGGVDLTEAAERIAACQLHSALAGIPYCTSVGRFDEAVAVAARIAPLLDGAPTL